MWKSIEELEKYCYMSSSAELQQIGQFIRDNLEPSQEALDSAWHEGYDEGHQEGYDEGMSEGYDEDDLEKEYDKGYNQGYEEGKKEGYSNAVDSCTYGL